ncbi:ATP-binding protein [Insolitispirillum peregrinum]|uniref:histidine kinase n=1 Tax=Insolitispirillum peregrinum TaxID=80876 RepID=A0A1N7Q7T9_9PROT|nr:ATP-binding protein [Insolitispirillum peregrinum]SIT18819.1 PAS fold-containing protein [Insolitispirillum peregrinum]
MARGMTWPRLAPMAKTLLRWRQRWWGLGHSLWQRPLLGGVLVVVVSLGMVLYAVADFDHQRVRVGVEQTARSLSLALRESVARSFAEVDRLLVTVGHGIETGERAQLPQASLLPPYVRTLSIVSADGETLERVGDADGLSSAELYRYLQGLPQAAPPPVKQDGVVVIAGDARETPGQGMRLGAVVISPPYAIPVTPEGTGEGHGGERRVFVSRAVYGEGQTVRGWVVATLDPNVFGGFYRALDMADSSEMVVLRRDGEVIGRAPYRVAGAAGSWRGSLLFRRLLEQASQGLYWGQNGDLAARLDSRVETSQPPGMFSLGGTAPFVYGYAALADYPLVVVVGVPARDAFASWGARALTLVLVGCSGVFALLFLARQVSVYLRSLHQSEQRYRAAETHLSHAQSLAHIGSWEWSLRDNRMWWSAELARICGLSGSTGRGSAANPSYEMFLTLVHPEDRARTAIVVGKALEDGQAFSIDYRIRRHDGSVRHLHHEGQCVLEEDGSVGRMDCVIQDVTESATLHAQLAQAAKLSTLGEMPAGMAHELSQPLNIVKMSVEGALLELEARDGRLRAEDAVLSPALRRAVAQESDAGWLASGIARAGGRSEADGGVSSVPPAIHAALQRVASQADRMGQILEHIRIFSQRDTAPVHIFDGITAVAVAGQVMQGQCADAGIELRIDLPPQRAAVKGRAVQLEQVLVNLLSNAKDSVLGHLGKGYREQRSLPLAAGVPPRGFIRLSGRVVGGDLHIVVSDNGGGIPASLSNRLFEPFFTTKSIGQGAGLGLSVAYGIITAMGGSLSARNDEQGGACFEIRLPLETGAVLAGPLAEQPRRVEPVENQMRTVPDAANAWRILLIESETGQSSLLRAALIAKGLDVLVASKDEEAVGLLRSKAVQLVLIDAENVARAEVIERGSGVVQAVRRVDPLVPILHILPPADAEAPFGPTPAGARGVYRLPMPAERSRLLAMICALLEDEGGA